VIGQTRMGRLLGETRRDTLQINRIEIIAIDQVEPNRRAVWVHTRPLVGREGDLDQVEGRLRDRATEAGSNKPIARYRINCLQRGHANFAGHPWTPRKGDLAVVLWYGNEKGVVLGTIPNIQQETVCRPDNNDLCLDEVLKLCPAEDPLRRNPEGDFTEFPLPRDPVCVKWYDERETGKGRDVTLAFRCKPGNDRPQCDHCTGPDILKQDCTWLKWISDVTLAADGDKPDRLKIHHKSGTTIFLDLDGTFYIENRVAEAPKAHFKLFPDGTVQIQSRSNESGEVCGLDGDGSGATSGARLKLFPNGEAILHNLNADAFVRIEADGNIHIKSPIKITLDAPLTHVTGNHQIDGSCDHGPCSCPPCQ